MPPKKAAKKPEEAKETAEPTGRVTRGSKKETKEDKEEPKTKIAEKAEKKEKKLSKVRKEEAPAAPKRETREEKQRKNKEKKTAMIEEKKKIHEELFGGDKRPSTTPLDKKAEEEREVKKVSVTKEEKKESAKGTPIIEEKIVKVIKKGKGAVDCSVKRNDLHVYESGGLVFSVSLNQSNTKQNNNKYYIIQLLETDSAPHSYFTLNRWGRVGTPGQSSLNPMGSLEAALRDYNSKHHDKTVKGNYREVAIDLGDEDKADEDGPQESEADKVQRMKEKEDKDFSCSSLPRETKEFVKLIFDMKMMDNQMAEIGYDAKKMPLGKLARSSIQKGYETLNKISKELTKTKVNQNTLADLSSDFFSDIPHDFGFSNMRNFIIKDHETIKKKLEMLNSLENAQIATKLLKENSMAKNMIDENYSKLECLITPLVPGSSEYTMIEKYLQNTHAETHRDYDLELISVLKVAKDLDQRFRSDIQNRILLWHGSRISNFVGILSQGLRIAPPEAPVTGYMFGKGTQFPFGCLISCFPFEMTQIGIYFADSSSKSANYCRTSPSSPVGVLLLCEVAVGTPNKLYYADYHADQLPKGTDSTMGCGKTGPKNPIEFEGMKVFQSKLDSTGVAQTSLLYNEYIVYNVNQAKFRYVLTVNFKFKNRY